MANNRFQVKRTTISGRTPNTTNSGNTHFIDTGELAINLTDGKMFSSSGSAYFEVGANLQNVSIESNATFGSTGKIIANGSFGTSGQVLASNGTSMYWSTAGGGGSGTVTQVNTGIGLAGGPITATGTIEVLANNGIVANSTGLFANAGTGVVVNATGIHVNSSYIGTLSSNNSSFLGGFGAASYVQNTDSRTLSGNLVISGTSFTPSSNTVLLGNSTQRWVVSANTGDFSGTVTGTVANMSTSVNSALLTVGTDFIANTTGLYHTGTINAASITIGTDFIANSTAVVISKPLTANGSTGTTGQVLSSNGSSGSPYWVTVAGGGSVTSVASGDGLTGGPITTTGTLSISAQSGLLANSTGLYVNATSIALGTVPTAILGSGTANSTTFLAGDQTFKTISAGSTVTDDTTTNGSRYVLFANQTSGTLTDEYVSSTKMYFNPSTGKLNATSFNSLSDVFSKENIKTLDNAISKILMMRGVSFTWKGTEDKSIGLIAQEVEQIIPEVVSTSQDGIKSVSYDSIIGLLVEGIKEQQQTIEQMQSSINILLGRINTEGEGK